MTRRAVLLLVGGIPLAAACEDGAAPARQVVFPLSAWTVTQDFGVWNPNWEGYHLAQDAAASPGDPVLAPMAGRVRAVYFGADVVGYGGLLLVEHATDAGPIVTLYGHVSTRRGAAVAVGATVGPGDTLAYVADDDEDGGPWGPHLHFGIRRGAFDPDATICGVWLYVGYTRACPGVTHEQHRSLWYDPSDVLGSAAGAGIPDGGPGPAVR